jgi:hypothetical protein
MEGVVPTGIYYTIDYQYFVSSVDQFVDLEERTLLFLTRHYPSKFNFTKIKKPYQ